MPEDEPVQAPEGVAEVAEEVEAGASAETVAATPETNDAAVPEVEAEQ